MQCPEENEIVDFLQGGLDPEHAERLEAHFDACPGCIQVVGELARIFRSEPEAPPKEQPLEETLAVSDAGTDASEDGPMLPPLFAQGDSIGRYIVLDRIGAGGMGIVYSAYDPELDRKVALKLLHHGAGDEGPASRSEQRARLLREAQAMAKLSHPNVITVHDVGTVGVRVFLAMEFVEGTTLTKWVKEHPRTLRELLEVFLAAGRGLRAAHAASLVHRDFKPDNVLMGKDGRVVVTDFGLARPMTKGAAASLSSMSYSLVRERRVVVDELTQTGALIGTPAYMAPEQLAGEASDALADQFSFCVALYEALHGERPFAGETLAELVANVTTGRIRPPPRESSVPRWLRRALLKGLATRPRDRHPDMDALLVELESDPWKIWRRRAIWAVPGSAFVAGLAAWLSEGATRSRAYCDDVDERLASLWSDERRREIEDAFEAIEVPYARDAWESSERRIDTYAQAWTSAQRKACQAQVEGSQPRSVVALRMMCLQRQLGQLDALLELFTHPDSGTIAGSLSATESLRSPALCEDIDRLTSRMAIFDDQATEEERTRVAEQIDQARVLRLAGKHDRSDELAREAQQRAQAMGDAWHEAEALVLQASGSSQRGESANAEVDYHRAISAALSSGHTEIIARAALGLVWLHVGPDRSIAEAERWGRHAKAAISRLGEFPELQAELDHVLGAAYLEHGRFEEAEAHLQRAIELRAEVFGPDDSGVGSVFGTLGKLYAIRGDFGRALQTFEHALDLVEKQYGPHHPAVAASLDSFAACLGQMGEYERSAEAQRRALAIRTATFGPYHPDNGTSHHNLAISLLAQNRLDEALEHALAAKEIYEKAYGDEDEAVADAHVSIGNVLDSQGKRDEAIAAFERALEIARQSLRPDHPRLMHYEMLLGDVLREVGRLEEAMTHLERTLATPASDARATQAQAMMSKALILGLDWNRLQEALPLAEQAVRETEAATREPRFRAGAHWSLALLLTELPDDQARQRAIDQARLAADLYREAGPLAEGSLREVETWLSHHATPRVP